VARSRPGLIVVVLLIAVLGTAIVPTVGATDPPSQPGSEVTRGEPGLDVYLTDDEVTPGTETNLEFEIVNDGEIESGTETDRVLTAQGVTTEIVDDGPFEATSGETPLADGQIQDGTVATAHQQIVVPDDVEPGEYTVTIEVSYSYVAAVSRITENARKDSNTETYDVTVEVPDEPRFAVVDTATEAEPGTSGDATVEIENVGTETAYELEGTLASDSGISFDGGSAQENLGDLGPGDTAAMTVDTDIPASMSGGEKPFTAEFIYEDEDGVERTAETARGSLAPADSLSFSLADLEGDLSVGHEGELEGTVVNDGPRPVDDAVLVAETGSESLAIGDERYALPALDPGEEATVRFEVDVSEEASEGPRQLRFHTEYTAGDGMTVESDPFTERVEVEAGQSFSITDVDDTLMVGYDGEVTGTVTNDGPRDVDDAVLIAEPQSDSLHVEDTRYALPELKAGESADFRYPTDVGGQADEGPRQVQFTVEYTDGDRTLTSDRISQRVVVDPREDEFSIESVDTQVAAGETTEIVLEITNERPETLSNIDAMLYTDSPLDSDGDEAFVSELEPGESTEIPFELEVDEDARETTYPVEIDFEYDTERGETELSDAYQHPIEVTENEGSDGSRFPFLVTAFGAVTVVGLGVGLWLRQS